MIMMILGAVLPTTTESFSILNLNRVAYAGLVSYLGYRNDPGYTNPSENDQEVYPSSLFQHLAGSRLIGSGSYGSVYAISGPDPEEKFSAALKLNHDVESEAQEREMENLAFLQDRPKDAHILEVWKIEKPFVITELCEGGTLWDLLRSSASFPKEDEPPRGFLTEADVRTFVTQMNHMLRYLAQHGIIHHDIHLRNLCFSDAGRTQLKLIDFGCAELVRKKGHDDVEEVPVTTLTNAIDIYSFGKVLYYMAYGFPTSNGKKLNFNFSTPTNGPISRELKSFIRKCLHRRPDRRPTLAEFHAFATGSAATTRRRRFRLWHR